MDFIHTYMCIGYWHFSFNILHILESRVFYICKGSSQSSPHLPQNWDSNLHPNNFHNLNLYYRAAVCPVWETFVQPADHIVPLQFTLRKKSIRGGLKYPLPTYNSSIPYQAYVNLVCPRLQTISLKRVTQSLISYK